MKQIKINWRNRKPNVATIGIPIVVAMSISRDGICRDNQYKISFLNNRKWTIVDDDVPIIFEYKFVDNVKPKHIFCPIDVSSVCVPDCFSFKSIKDCDIDECGMIGYHTDINHKICNSLFYDSIRSIGNHYVVLYGEIPPGTKYYQVKDIKGKQTFMRIIPETIKLFPISVQKEMNRFTGYEELLKYIN